MPFPQVLDNIRSDIVGGTNRVNVHAAHHDALATAVNSLETEVRGQIANVRYFGALGDGTTDDSNAIYNALISLPLAGGTLYFPPSVTANPYILNTLSIAQNNVTILLADGVTIKLKGQAGGPQVPLLTIDASNIKILGGTLDGNSGTIAAGSGNYWNGLVQISGGRSDVTVSGVRIQNTARCGIYAYGYVLATTRITIENCRFTGIGLPGAGNGGACIMFDGGITASRVKGCYAFGTLTSNFLKMKVNVNNCTGNEIDGNLLDYRSCTTFDATNGCLGIEMWNGSYTTRCTRNHIYGPNTVPVAGAFWGISCGDARGSTVDSNIIVGSSTAITAMTYGLEVGECPSLLICNNQISWCNIGSNATNNYPQPTHEISFTGNTWQNCYTNGVQVDSAPGGIKFAGDTFIDCGTAYLFFNSYNVTGGDGTVKDAIVSACTFKIKDQTRLHGEGRIFGIYVAGLDVTKIARVSIDHCNFGPYQTVSEFLTIAGSTTTVLNLPTAGGASYTPDAGSLVGLTLICRAGANAGQSKVITANTTTTITTAAFVSAPVAGDAYAVSGGIGTVGLTPLEVNNPRGVKIDHCHMDGARPDTFAAQADHAMLVFAGEFRADHNTAVNFTADFCTLVPGTAGQPQCTFDFNSVGSLPARIITNANTTFTEMYWSTADGRLHVRNAAGTDAAVGP